jgi:excisionase family DNA binding protein
MPEEKRYLSIPEAAKACGVSRATMWKWVKSGKIDAFATPGGHYRIRREDADRIVGNHVAVRKVEPPGTTILVVDDNPAIRKIFKVKLTRIGYRVVTAESGFEAGAIIYSLKPDLVLLDLFMEGIDGFEVCRTIKSDPTLTHIKVLAFSGVDIPEVHSRLQKAGADGFFPKGTDFNHALEQIQRLLASA